MRTAMLKFADPVCVDTNRLNAICDRMGPQGGEVLIGAAMEDVAVLVADAAKAWGRCDLEGLRAGGGQIASVAERLGLMTLSNVARSVAELCDASDDAALAANVARLVRLGEQSLIAIWEAQDMSG